jgi:hypothetical protein
MAVRKYLMEKGIRAFPTLSIPLSKGISLALVFLFGLPGVSPPSSFPQNLQQREIGSGWQRNLLSLT